MDYSAFITSLLTSFAIFCLLVLVYTVLSRWPMNYNIYYCSRILSGSGPPPLPPRSRFVWNPFAWIKEAFIATDVQLAETAGLDATIYINFFSTALEIFGYSALFCMPVLIPIAVTSHQNERELQINPNNTYEPIDNLAIGNVEPGSSKLWAFLIGIYWVSFVTYYVLVKNYKHMIDLRTSEQAHEKACPQQFSCLVRDIPKPPRGMTRVQQVDTFFKKLHPDSYEKCMVVTNHKKLSEMWSKLESAKKSLVHVESQFDLSKSPTFPEGNRPTHKTGLFGLWGEKVDSIDFYNEQIKELAPQVATEQCRTLEEEQKAAAFVFFNNRRAAAEASQVVHAPYAMQWQVFPAPEPREVVWENLAKPLYERMVRETIIYIFVFFTVVFYMIPIAFISSLTTLNNLVKLVPFIKAIVDYPPLNTVLQAYLPQLALIIFLALLPGLLMLLSRHEGIPSQSLMVRATSGKYFYFVVFNVFIGVTLFGTIFSSLDGFQELLNSRKLSVSNVVTLFGNKLPPNATYFITFVALQFFVGYGLELSRLVPLTIYHLKRKYLCKTEKEVEEAWAPGPLTYETLVPNDMLIVTITLCYSVISPIILIFGLLYFGIGWLVLRNQALKVYVPSFESSGRMWPHIHSRILASLFVAQITMIGYFGIKKFPYTVLVIFLPFITIGFTLLCKMNYYPSFQVTSLAIASEVVTQSPSLSAIINAYTPTCLQSEADKSEDNDRFEDARSNVSSRTDSGINFSPGGSGQESA
ncbi:unnamed protein product [Sphagnum balticum]